MTIGIGSTHCYGDGSTQGCEHGEYTWLWSLGVHMAVGISRTHVHFHSEYIRL